MKRKRRFHPMGRKLLAGAVDFPVNLGGVTPGRVRPGDARRRRCAAVTLAAVLGLLSVGLLATPANAWEPYCGESEYVDHIMIQDFTDGQFQIKVYPTSNARHAFWLGYRGEATNSIWKAVQKCKSGLYDTLADGIYQQIDCHVYGSVGGYLNLGGEAYEFESWRKPTDWSKAIRNECNWDGEYEKLDTPPYRPDRPLPVTPPPAAQGPSQLQPAQGPSQPQPSTVGVHIQDAFSGGTWARLDPDNGAWYPQGSRPGNGKYWFPNGLGVAVDCTRQAAPYSVSFADGHRETWSYWAHVTDGTWVPVAVFEENFTDGDLGLARC